MSAKSTPRTAPPPELSGPLRMECLYLLRGHEARARAVRRGTPLPDGERKKLAAVQSALAVIEPALQKAALRSLTERVAYEHIGPPCGRQTFYRRRRRLLTAIAAEMGYL